MDQKYAKVRLLFTLKNYARPRFFKHLRPGMLVRDEGVAGSNPGHSDQYLAGLETANPTVSPTDMRADVVGARKGGGPGRCK